MEKYDRLTAFIGFVRTFGKIMSMTRVKSLPPCSLLLIFLLSGCGHQTNYLDVLYYETVQELDRAIVEARLVGAEEFCPEELQEVMRLRQTAEDAQHSCCKTKEATKIARAAIEKANSLCPPPPGSGDSPSKSTK